MCESVKYSQQIPISDRPHLGGDASRLDDLRWGKKEREAQ